MRLALIADIHGNLVALDTVLEDVRRHDVDEIICLGDVAGIGPQPKETLARLGEIGCPIVMGNDDAELLHLEPGYRSGRDEVDRRTREVIAWCRSQLSPDDLAFIRSFRPVVERSLGPNVPLLCFHGSPRSYTELIMWTTPAAELDQMIGTDRNPWSGEVPQEEIRFAEWAEYALVTCREGGLGVELRRVTLDREEVGNAALKAGRPYARQWAAAWIERIPLLASLTD